MLMSKPSVVSYNSRGPITCGFLVSSTSFQFVGHSERIDGNIKEEIKVMYDCFGEKIFEVMVIIATNPKKPRYQQCGV